MMGVAIETDPELTAGVSKLLFEGAFLSERPASGSRATTSRSTASAS